ncbi:MAG TPA: hypothetical protein VGO46_08305 [Gemmatimonadaceae bacterium]|jgi:hypothetical protein|nr:hypothetical protein [Gemmatimonadaceae bacterium]
MKSTRMTRNQKLTPILKGRTIAKFGWDGATVLLHFDDGSELRIHTRAKTKGDAPSVTVGRVVAVRQSMETIAFDLESGSSIQIPLAEPASCVMLRDSKGVLEYAD